MSWNKFLKRLIHRPVNFEGWEQPQTLLVLLMPLRLQLDLGPFRTRILDVLHLGVLLRLLDLEARHFGV